MASSSQNRQATANRGGASSIPTPANSGGSGLFGGASVGATHDPVQNETHRSTSIDGGKRRLSQSQGGMFGNLHNVKRGSQDMGTAQRKASMSEQMAKPGILGSMWTNLTSGSGSK